jgi:hypothetical protein
MKAGRTTHRKIAATVARFNRDAAPAKVETVEDAAYWRAKLARPFLSPRDRRHYAAKLAAIETADRARKAARAALSAESEGRS